MALQFAIPTPLDYFGALVRSDGDFALFEAAVTLAQDEYPETDVQTVLGEVDQLLARVKRRLAADAPPIQRLRMLNRFFYDDLGFGGNLNNYYDPDNSFPSVLLRTRRGIPISLAVVWMELAQGLGLEVYGVGFPGHFLVKVMLPIGQAVIEPLTGRSLSREELSEMLEPYRKRSGLVDAFEAPLGLYLQSATPREILARMLRNLKEIYKSQEDWPRLLAVQERLVVLLPESWSEYRDRGLVHASLGHQAEALADLECYLVHAENVVDVDAVAERVSLIRRQMRLS
ncbi:MAG: transglutaminase [Curvibacter sp. RIFCSPHIGHO2_12_FULL_63_18]|uniref:SirB1 family protein n=1 Tax=Rhodoferax sp. TaxID=50421 RepID=UPI0008C8B333|nr:tetratricopeptide repeat protein [Rhodoferax sp.]OGO98227.1 MAG: transglutaminase [Curvibacter sp. GWA2_63_95]OGP06550.1 MAG: transglutaminase [Curvibacter sp. RIFCSPHIGHO2_12_FULL_63_18]HCX82910.1 transglutaminase [Rhodoferax sp.]